MKTILTSASLAALGVLSLQAAYDPGLSATEKAKPWSISASLRGFYDDNYATLPSKRSDGGPTERDSFGVDFSPRFSLNFPMEATLASLDYIYGLRWYEDRENNSADHSHQVNARFNHAFSENYKLDIADSFVVAQEPELLDPTGGGLRLRADGNNIRNTAAIKFQAQLTRLFGTEVGYANSLYDYDNTGPGSYSALLDRMEHLAHLNLRWNVWQQTVALLGYQYGIIDHTSKDSLVRAGTFPGFPGINYVDPEIRDSQSHYIYVGADHNFTQAINASLRVGAQYTKFNNADDSSMVSPATDVNLKDDSLIPYVDANVSYAYTVGSYVQLGIKHSRVQTDLLALDQEATTLYGAINHQITPKLTASLLGQYQNASFEQGLGGLDGKDEDYFAAGLNLGYQINQYLTAETGYNFDRLSSGALNRSFTRNRVYIGLRASY